MRIVLSLDVESNGLYGQPFAIGWVVADVTEGKILSAGVYNCPIQGTIDPWVQQNVIPFCPPKNTHTGLSFMLDDFYKVYQELIKLYGNQLMTIGHCIAPVETNLFRLMVKSDISNRAFSLQCPIIHELGTMLAWAGEDPASVDKVINQNNLQTSRDMLLKIIAPSFGESSIGEHNPLYDAVNALTVYRFLLLKFNSGKELL